MKRLLLTTALCAFVLSPAAAFAAGDDYDANGTSLQSMDRDATVTHDSRPSQSLATKKMHKKKSYKKRRTGAVRDRAMNEPVRDKGVRDDGVTSRQGQPAGEISGPVTNQTDDQNYGQPYNH